MLWRRPWAILFGTASRVVAKAGQAAVAGVIVAEKRRRARRGNNVAVSPTRYLLRQTTLDVGAALD